MSLNELPYSHRWGPELIYGPEDPRRAPLTDAERVPAESTPELRAYPEYIPTGIDWLGEIPSHWMSFPNRTLFHEIIDRNHPDEQMLSVTIGHGITTQRSLLEDSSKKDSSNLDRSAYKLVQTGDLVYNKMRAWQGAIGISNFEGIVSPAYIVLRPAATQYPDYVHYLFRTPAFAKEAERWSYGITSDQWSLRSEDFKQIYSLLPPLAEQIAIANFLDAMDARITTYIAAKRKMIALLEEQKQAIINQAVTRVLDPDVPLKPSGVDWLGDIPAHWEVRRAKQIWTEVDERSEYGEEELLSVSHLTGVTPRSEKNITMFQAESYAGHKLCRLGDLVVNTMWAWMGALGVSKQLGIVSSSYAVYRPRRAEFVIPDYMETLLRTELYVDEYNRQSTGIHSSRMRLYPDQFLRLPILLPPVVEQASLGNTKT